jgi:phospholipid/cholesterol/gamma-HCH transport system substrate-binding protein
MKAETKVGILVFVSIICLAILLFWVGVFNIFRGGYRIYVDYPQIGGLSEGSSVRMAGVLIGKVEKIELVDKENKRVVRCKLWIQTDTPIPEGSRFTINMAGLLAEKYIEILPGDINKPAIKKEAVLEGESGADIGALLSSGGDLFGQLKDISSGIKKLTDDETIHSIKNTIKNAENTTQNLDNLIEDSQDDIHVTLYHLRSISARLDQMLARNEDNLDSTFADAKVIAGNLKEITGNVQSIAQKIDSGQGTVGKLVNDPALHDELLATTKEAKDLIKDFQANPTRYIQLSIF